MNNIIITGPTASGKTSLAVAVCREIGGEIISADSRQVYRGMDIGTGKDLNEYLEGGSAVSWHLINIRDPGENYHVHAFQHDAVEAAHQIRERGQVPVFCGGTGLYLEAIMESHAYTAIPVNHVLRDKLVTYGKSELIELMNTGENLPFQVDMNSTKRLIRAIEIQHYLKENSTPPVSRMPEPFTNFIIEIPREERRRRITARLDKRLKEGLVEEVRLLLQTYSPDTLLYYGLEYRYITEYLTGKHTYQEMYDKLNTEIHRFAKRQMTWFRRMERKGIRLYRVDGTTSMQRQLDQVLKNLY